MTPDRFAACLKTLGWSQRHLASLLACDTNLPTRWAAGRAAIPESIAKWLERCARMIERNPPPDDWRVKTADTPKSTILRIP